jgi:signal transduction histidine kinase
MSIPLIPYAAACVMIVIALMTTVRHRPVTVMAWSMIAMILQTAIVPAAELAMSAVPYRIVQSTAAFFLLGSILFPAIVWLNPPVSAAERGIAYYASAAVALVLACGGIILALDPLLSPQHAGAHVQYRLFRTEPFTIVTMLIGLFFVSYAVMMMRRARASRSRSERRKLRLIGFFPLSYSSAVIASSYAASDPIMYAVCISTASVLAAFVLIDITADWPPHAHRPALPAEMSYGVASAVLFSLSFAAIDVAGSALASAFGANAFQWKIGFVVCLGLLLWPFVMRAQKNLQRIFSKDIEKVRSLFFEFTERARSMTSIEAIAEAFCSYFEDAFSVSRCEIFLLDEAASAFRCVQMHERSFPSNGSLQEICSASTVPLAVAECIGACTADEQRILREYEKGSVTPIFLGRRIKGFLFVGPRVTGNIFHNGTASRDLFTPAVQALTFIVDRQNLIEQLRRDEARFAQEDRLAILGTFGAGIAHELRNPLNVISTSAQTILRRPDDFDMHAEVAHFISEESIRMSHTIDEFLRFSRSNVPEWRNDDIRNIVDNALRPLQTKLEARRINVSIDIPPNVSRVVTSVRHLEHALGNIMQNAVEAMDENGSLSVTVNEEPHDHLSIRIKDTGRGIPKDLLEKIFDPFFTTKTDGTGLGLPIVRMILNNIGASVTASSQKVGAEFTVSLPIDGRVRYD